MPSTSPSPHRLNQDQINRLEFQESIDHITYGASVLKNPFEKLTFIGDVNKRMLKMLLYFRLKWKYSFLSPLGNMPFAACSVQRARLIVFVTHPFLGVCISLFVCACGLVQQDSNTHVLLRGPSATCRPVCLSPSYPRVISELQPLGPLAAHTLTRQRHSIGGWTCMCVLCQLNMEMKN